MKNRKFLALMYIASLMFLALVSGGCCGGGGGSSSNNIVDPNAPAVSPDIPDESDGNSPSPAPAPGTPNTPDNEPEEVQALILSSRALTFPLQNLMSRFLMNI